MPHIRDLSSWDEVRRGVDRLESEFSAPSEQVSAAREFVEKWSDYAPVPTSLIYSDYCLRFVWGREHRFHPTGVHEGDIPMTPFKVG